MLLILQITFTILSAVCVAAFMPIGAFFGFIPAIGVALAAVMFFMLMKLCKQSLQLQASKEEEKTETDFFNPPENDE